MSLFFSKTVKSILLILLLSLSAQSHACVLYNPLTEFKASKSKLSEPQPDRPSFILVDINRGRKMTDNTSCRWLATMGNMSFKLTKPLNNYQSAQGYLFEIAKGKLDKGRSTLFRPFPVILKRTAEEKNIYSFMWSDGNSNAQEPFNITVKITAVAKSGIKSKPQYIRVSHNGVTPKHHRAFSFFSQAK